MSVNTTQKLNEIRNAALEAAEWVTRAYSPQWKARMDVAKSLIPIASGALVLTIAFAPSLAKPNTHYAWRYCLIGGWFCFLGALISALLALWFSIGLHDAQANVLEQSEKLRKELAKPGVSRESMNNVLDDIFVTANRPIERRDKASRRLLNAAYIFYGFAIVLVSILGARQMFV